MTAFKTTKAYKGGAYMTQKYYGGLNNFYCALDWNEFNQLFHYGTTKHM